MDMDKKNEVMLIKSNSRALMRNGLTFICGEME
jgi:hypothetical protein